MSFILDALKKSENERQRTVGPSLADAPIRRARPDRPLWAVAVAVLLVINLGVLVTVLMRNDATAKTEPQAAVAPPAAQQAAPVAPAPAVEYSAQPALVPAEPVQPSPNGYRAPTNPAVRSLAEEAGAPGGTYSDPRMNAAMAAAAAVPPGPALVRPIQPPSVTPLPSDPTFKSVDASGRAAAPSEEVLPTAGDLIAGGTRLPEMKLDIHVYAANPAERFVFVNMRKYLEGQKLQEGPVVEKILDDSVVLNQNGLRFVLPRQ